jgi:hypothetical protein
MVHVLRWLTRNQEGLRDLRTTERLLDVRPQPDDDELVRWISSSLASPNTDRHEHGTVILAVWQLDREVERHLPAGGRTHEERNLDRLSAVLIGRRSQAGTAIQPLDRISSED